MAGSFVLKALIIAHPIAVVVVVEGPVPVEVVPPHGPQVPLLQQSGAQSESTLHDPQVPVVHVGSLHDPTQP